ncbi:hypothetical protein [Streptacidiphilus sp. EB129]|uniref:hypothetical protein n=1 Tax=Streptacidiphilus sp. EB129 TaxID=3156262 RepID=UPI003513B88B
MRMRQKFVGAAAALLLSLGSAAFGMVAAPAAHAAASDCENGANGFVDISDNASGTVERSVTHDADTISLQSAGGRGFAKIEGNTINNVESVWMDWTQNGGSTWLQCGPFVVNHGNGTSKTSAAQLESSSSQWQFRACGYTADAVITCTAWW